MKKQAAQGKEIYWKESCPSALVTGQSMQAREIWDDGEITRRSKTWTFSSPSFFSVEFAISQGRTDFRWVSVDAFSMF